MRFAETELRGAYIIELEFFRDARGLFARTFCAREFEKVGLKDVMVQGTKSRQTRA